jgi:hypothetical protein
MMACLANLLRFKVSIVLLWAIATGWPESTSPARAQAPAKQAPDASATELGIKDTQFTLNGEPTFLLGISYYGALGASEDFIRRDLDDMQHYGFNWIRVFATWDFFDNDVSALDGEGNPRELFLGKLKWLVAESDRRGVVVDVTLARGDGKTGGCLQTLAAHRRAVETLVTALKPRRNWYLDLANERNIPEFFTSLADVKALRDAARQLDPQRLVTASHTPDLSRDDLRAYLLGVQVDFISPHRPRHAQSPAQTAAKSREYLAWMKEIGRVVPLHYQEPFRSGWAKWQPKAADFITDLHGAKAGGAAGWCFHNGDQGGRPDGKPRRSFDLREQRLFEQLDEEERKVLARLAALVPPPGREKEVGFFSLFNGQDFTGWRTFLDPRAKDADPKKIWTIQDGIIQCEGSVPGYIITDKEYENYVLRVQWRWGSQVTSRRNSGVFLHVVGEDKIWPKGIEAQLMADHAGDFWLSDRFNLKIEPQRRDPNPKFSQHYFRIKDGDEKPLGEWNQYEITCQGDTVRLVINGQLVNEGTECEVRMGKILLQSEGAEIHFRNIELKPIQ